MTKVIAKLPIWFYTTKPNGKNIACTVGDREKFIEIVEAYRAENIDVQIGLTDTEFIATVTM